MEKIVKLTYLTVYKYNLSLNEWNSINQRQPHSGEFAKILAAQLHAERYNMSITDVVDFMRKYKWSILKYTTR